MFDIETVLRIAPWVAAIGYLLQKVLLFAAEGSETSLGQKARMFGWIAYLIGLPAWLVVFGSNSRWIAMAVEAGGAPSMILGLIIAIRGSGKEPRWLDLVALIAAVIGSIYSVYDFGGFTALTQWLEAGIAVGFLMGTYLLAKKNPNGWLWYMLMNVSNAILQTVDGDYVLTAQQVLSLGFVIAGYLKSRRNKKAS